MPEEQYMHKDIQDIHSKDGRAPVRDLGQLSGQAVMELDNVSRSFNKGTVQAVRDVSFKLHPGEILGLIGVNGAGKTTTVKMCSTLLDPTSGQIHVAGIDTHTSPREARSHIGLMLGGSGGFYPRSTLKDNLLFFADLAGVSSRERQAEVRRTLELVSLGDMENRKAYELSRGQRQRLHIARALLGSPELLLLDEPTTGLDPDIALKIRGLIRSVADSGVGILLTSHSMEEAEELADRFVVIDRGAVRVSGSLDDVARYADISRTTTFTFTPSGSFGLDDISQLVDNDGFIMHRAVGSQWRVTVMWHSAAAGRVAQRCGAIASCASADDLLTRPANLEDAFLAIAEMGQSPAVSAASSGERG